MKKDESGEPRPEPKKGQLWKSFRGDKSKILDVSAIGITVKGTWGYTKTFSKSQFEDLYPEMWTEPSENRSRLENEKDAGEVG